MSVHKLDYNCLSKFRRSPKYTVGIKRELKEPKSGEFVPVTDVDKVKFPRSPQWPLGSRDALTKSPSGTLKKSPSPGEYGIGPGQAMGEDNRPSWSLRGKAPPNKVEQKPGPGQYKMPDLPEGQSFSLSGRPSTAPDKNGSNGKKSKGASASGTLSTPALPGFGSGGPKYSFRPAPKTEGKASHDLKVPGPGAFNSSLGTLGSHPSVKVGPSFSFTARPANTTKAKHNADFPPLGSSFG
mmetsp:Transcript_29807/g.44922  ORF Transcript_29807/g.44922 Transcript_29807/m.44922 type:complete len:239 (-) Transcript_29807:176-892(-)